MNITEFLQNLSSQNVKLWVDGDELRYRAPQEILTPAILNEIKRHKPEIINILKSGAAIPNTFLLSVGQQALYFLYKLEPLNTAYNVAYTARIRSHVDVRSLRLAVESLIARHPMLHTTFREQDGELLQDNHSNYEICFEEVDASTLNFEELKQQVVKANQRPFNLETGPIARVTLFYLKDQDYILLLSIHHIACDGWSIWMLVDELLLLYAAQKKGVAASLSPINFTYKNFVDWQDQLLNSSQRESLWAYWQQQLAGELPVLNLATDKVRPPVKTYHGASHSFKLSQQLIQKLKELAKLEGVTLYMVTLAVFQVLLHRYTGQEDILVGSPTLGRSKAEFEQIVGYFVNPVVQRANFSGDPTFQTFLAQVRSTVLGAITHQDYPFPLLVKQLQPNRDQSRSPVFQAFFVWQKPQLASLIDLLTQSKTQAARDDLLLEPFEIMQQEEQFDLSLEMIEANESLFSAFKYNTDLFERSTIERMAAHFQNLLSAIVENPQLSVGTLPLLSEAERYQLLVEWNETTREYPKDKCIHQLFEEQVERTPFTVAVVFEEEQLTYQQLNQRSNQLAHYLQSLGVKSEVLVGICVERSIEMVVGLLGILKAGGAYVPLDPAYPQERLSYTLADSGVEVLLTQQQLLSSLPSHTAQMVCLDTGWRAIEQHSQDNLDAGVSSNNLAYVIYTSGSTGQPKGVAIEHQSPVSLCYWAKETFTTSELSGVLAATSICFDLSVFELFVTLCVGGKVIVAQNALDILNLNTAEEITLINTVPSVIAELLRIGGIPAQVQTVNLAGEPLQNQIVEQLYQNQNIEKVYNLYGPSEDTTYSTKALIEKGTTKPPSIGCPISNTQIYILDSHLQPVPIGVSGELYIGGDSLARGYLNRPELTQEKFIQNPFSDSKSERLYKTGDLARYSSDGDITFIGRIDLQVKVRGFRIEPGEIEAVLNTHPQIEQAVVIATEDIPGNKQLVAYIAGHSVSLDSFDLRDFLRSKLPNYMIPNAFVVLESLPLMPNGKIDRKALPAPELQRIERKNSFIKPKTDLEEIISQIWQDILGIDQVSIHDNFFDLGGHSLLLTKLKSQLSEQLNQEISVLELFKFPTISTLAQHLNKSTNKIKPENLEDTRSQKRISRQLEKQQRRFSRQNRRIEKL